MYTAVGYHTRAYLDTTQKISGGFFRGGLDAKTIGNLINAYFDVKIMSGGRAVFVDKNGRPVFLYITVDPSMTAKGKELIAANQAAQRSLAQALQAQEIREREELEDVMQGLSHAEIIKRLRGI